MGRAADDVASWASGACDHNDLTRLRQYASPSVYAKRSCSAGDPCDVLALLHGPHRMGCRLGMILLSQHGWAAASIAGGLGCDPRTVRRLGASLQHLWRPPPCRPAPTGSTTALRVSRVTGWDRRQTTA